MEIVLESEEEARHVANRLKRSMGNYGSVRREGRTVVTNRPVCDVCHGWIKNAKGGSPKRHRVCAVRACAEELARYILENRGPCGTLKEPPHWVVAPYVGRVRRFLGPRDPTGTLRHLAMEMAKKAVG
jgi:hypothetical protein